MTPLLALLLGIVQGLTEFLPVSSSGHLVLLQHWVADLGGQELAFDVMVHLATLVAVIIFFRRDILRLLNGLIPGRDPEAGREILWIVVATIPTGFLGVLFKDIFTDYLSRPLTVGIALWITAAALLAAHYHGGGTRKRSDTGWWRALLIGIAQGLAITPGISRSGATIATGMMTGLRAEEAARFSFLISIPAILGAVVLNLNDMMHLFELSPGVMIAGFLGALISGYLALGLLMMLIRRRRLPLFAAYCVIIGLLAMLLS